MLQEVGSTCNHISSDATLSKQISLMNQHFLNIITLVHSVIITPTKVLSFHYFLKGLLSCRHLAIGSGDSSG